MHPEQRSDFDWARASISRSPHVFQLLSDGEFHRGYLRSDRVLVPFKHGEKFTPASTNDESQTPTIRLLSGATLRPSTYETLLTEKECCDIYSRLATAVETTASGRRALAGQYYKESIPKNNEADPKKVLVTAVAEFLDSLKHALSRGAANSLSPDEIARHVEYSRTRLDMMFDSGMVTSDCTPRLKAVFCNALWQNALSNVVYEACMPLSFTPDSENCRKWTSALLAEAEGGEGACIKPRKDSWFHSNGRSRTTDPFTQRAYLSYHPDSDFQENLAAFLDTVRSTGLAGRLEFKIHYEPTRRDAIVIYFDKTTIELRDDFLTSLCIRTPSDAFHGSFHLGGRQWSNDFSGIVLTPSEELLNRAIGLPREMAASYTDRIARFAYIAMLLENEEHENFSAETGHRLGENSFYDLMILGHLAR